MVRKTLTLFGALLALFHIWLFAGQVWQGELVDLALVSRWLIAVGLVAALVSLKRRGASMFWGKRAVAIWLLAALLHGPALARDFDVTTPALPEVTATLVKTGTTLAGLAGLGLLGLLVLAGGRRRASLAFRRLHTILTFVCGGPLSVDTYLAFAPRPPPTR